MKHSIWASCALAATVSTTAMAAGFTGPLAPGNFTTSNVGTITGSSPVLGTAVFTATQLTLTGTNSLSPAPAAFAPGCAGGVYATLASPCELRTTIGQVGLYTFSWTYTTSDGAGPPGDIFGVIVDGTHIALSSPGGAVTQSGTSSFTANSSFGWFMNCTDCISGAASAVVSNVSVVPEPANLALWLGGLLGLGGAVRWQSRREVRSQAGVGPQAAAARPAAPTR